MQSVQLKPKRADRVAQIVGLAVLCAAMFGMPILCPVLALLMPLLGCPLVWRREEAVAWVAACVPTAAALCAGYAPVYAASLALAGLLPLALTRCLSPKTRAGITGLACYVAAAAIALAAMAASAAAWLGAPLAQALPELAVSRVKKSGSMPDILYRCAAAGLVRVPDGFSPLLFRINPVQQRQMLQSLRLTLEILIGQRLPGLLVEISMAAGLFTVLRVRHCNEIMVVIDKGAAGEKRARVSAPPGFGQLTLPRDARFLVWGALVAALLLAPSGNDLASMLGMQAYALFETTFKLLGAAVLVGMRTARDPDQRCLWGVIAAALYVAVPVLLLLIGLTDQLFHFRSPQSGQTD